MEKRIQLGLKKKFYLDTKNSKQITIKINHSDGSNDTILTNHTYNDQQIEWYKEGSALNLIKKQNL